MPTRDYASTPGGASAPRVSRHSRAAWVIVIGLLGFLVGLVVGLLEELNQPALPTLLAVGGFACGAAIGFGVTMLRAPRWARNARVPGTQHEVRSVAPQGTGKLEGEDTGVRGEPGPVSRAPGWHSNPLGGRASRFWGGSQWTQRLWPRAR